MNALFNLFDRIALAVLMVNPGQWDDIPNAFPEH